MDEVEAMWMEMVVFRIDLMNNWTERHGLDRYDVDDITLLTHETKKDD